MIGTFLVVVLVAAVTEVKEPYGLLISIQQGPSKEHIYLNCNFCSSCGWLGDGLGKRGQPKELVCKRIMYKSLRCCLGGRMRPFFSHKGIPILGKAFGGNAFTTHGNARGISGGKRHGKLIFGWMCLVKYG